MWTKRTNITLIAALIGSNGCLPDLAGTTVPAVDATITAPSKDLAAAKKLFDDNVYPIIKVKCSEGCHAEHATSATITRFVATDPANGWQVATSYTALIGTFAPSTAPILGKLETGHYALTYTPDEQTKITEWLNKELDLRDGDPQPPPGEETLAQATERVLAEFAGCMTLPNFQTSNMADAFGGMRAQNNTECDNCHATGGYGFIASRDETFFYNAFSAKKYFFLQYFTVDTTAGAAGAKVVINTNAFIGVANGKDPHREHPRFQCEAPDCDNEGMRALRTFYDLTIAAKNAGGCPPRKLEN